MTAEPTYCSKRYKIDNVNASKVKLTSYKTRFTGDSTKKGIIKSHVILANFTIIATCNTTCSSVYLFGGVSRWWNQFFQILISFINITKEIYRKQSFECTITV